MRSIAAAVAMLAALSAGCTVGPNYSRPVVPVPETYRGAAPPAADASLADQILQRGIVEDIPPLLLGKRSVSRRRCRTSIHVRNGHHGT